MLCLLAVLSGCATGTRAFRNGDYTEAARVAADRLSWSPKAQKAGEIFLMAYPLAWDEWKIRLAAAESDTADPFHWERVVASYDALRDLSNRAALTPYRDHPSITIESFSEAYQVARGNAAAAREEAGDALMEHADLYASREAYRHYSVAWQYAPHREVLSAKLEEARALGTITVGLDSIRMEGHGINPSSLESELLALLSDDPGHLFVRFVRSNEMLDGGVDYFVTVSVGELSLERSDAEVGRTPYHRLIHVGHDSEATREVAAMVYHREKRFTTESPAWIEVYQVGLAESVLEDRLIGFGSWAARWDVLEGDKRAIGDRTLRLGEPTDPEFGELAQISTVSVANELHHTLVGFFSDK